MGNKKAHKEKLPRAPSGFKRRVAAILLLLGAVIIILSFFELAGIGGRWILAFLALILGRSAFFLPLFLLIGGISLWQSRLSHSAWFIFL